MRLQRDLLPNCREFTQRTDWAFNFIAEASYIHQGSLMLDS
jgi:hypothetical protein